MKRKLNNDKTILRVAIYVRVSTEQQAEDGDSIRDQLNSCEVYIKAHENMILAGEYIDGGISGQKTKREDLSQWKNLACLSRFCKSFLKKVLTVCLRLTK